MLYNVTPQTPNQNLNSSYCGVISTLWFSIEYTASVCSVPYHLKDIQC